MVVGIDDQGNRYVLEYFRKRVTPLVLADEIIKMYEKYKPAKTRIESVGYQEMLREYLRSKKYIPGLEIKETPRTQKSKRLEALQPHFAQKLMHLKKEHRDLVDELIMYPRGKHDDLLDGLYYASKGTYKPMHTLVDTQKAQMPDMEYNRKVDWMVV
jgi:predicted phage terminase large subunit-like protein